MLALVTAFSLAGAALAPAVARGERFIEQDEYDAIPATRWYGWQVLALDAAGLTAAISLSFNAGDSDEAQALAWGGGAATWLLGPAVVHLVHGRTRAAVSSVAVRAGLPVAGGFIGYYGVCTEANDGRFSCFVPMLGGILLGGLTAMIIDYGWLSSEERPAPERTTGLQVGLTPRADDGFTLSLGGAF